LFIYAQIQLELRIKKTQNKAITGKVARKRQLWNIKRSAKAK
jgi:hypothetical protein